jgi:hypothetical protein
MGRLARRMHVTFRDRRWQRLVEREMVVDLAFHVDEHRRVRAPKAPPGTWHANPRVNWHVGILIGPDRYEVLQRLVVRTERLIARRWRAIEAIADRLGEKPRLRAADVRRLLVAVGKTGARRSIAAKGAAVSPAARAPRSRSRRSAPPRPPRVR